MKPQEAYELYKTKVKPKYVLCYTAWYSALRTNYFKYEDMYTYKTMKEKREVYDAYAAKCKKLKIVPFNAQGFRLFKSQFPDIQDLIKYTIAHPNKYRKDINSYRLEVDNVYDRIREKRIALGHKLI